MALIDDLRRMYGLDPQDQQLNAMLAAQPPQPAPMQSQLNPMGLDPATASATGAGGDDGATDENDGAFAQIRDKVRAELEQSGQMGDPSVLGYVKTLEQQGAFGGKQESQGPGKGQALASETRKFESGGPSAEERAQDTAVRGQYELDTMQAEIEKRRAEADEMEKRYAYMKQDAQVAEEERKKQEAEINAKQERLRGQQEELAQQDDEPINPRRYWENMSIFGKAGAIISAAIHGYLGDPNTTADILNQRARDDVAAQVQQNASNERKRNALVEQYERQYGDTTLVAKRLEADKMMQMAKFAEAEKGQADTAEKRAAADELAKNLKSRVGVIHQDIQKATWGKPTEVSQTYQPVKPKGPADPLAKAERIMKLNKLAEEQGYDEEQRANLFKSQGMTPPKGKSELAQKSEADQAKRDALTPEQTSDMRKRVDGLAEMVQGMDELDKSVGFKRGDDGEVTDFDDKKLDASIRGAVGQVGQAAAGSLPWGMNKGAEAFMQKMAPEEVKSLERARDKIVFGQAKAEGAGALGDAERESYRQRIPTDSPLSVSKASAQIWRARRQQYDNLVGEYGKAAVDEALRKRGINPLDVGG